MKQGAYVPILSKLFILISAWQVRRLQARYDQLRLALFGGER